MPAQFSHLREIEVQGRRVWWTLQYGEDSKRVVHAWVSGDYAGHREISEGDKSLQGALTDLIVQYLTNDNGHA